jgi:hypothetical protein
LAVGKAHELVELLAKDLVEGLVMVKEHALVVVLVEE